MSPQKLLSLKCKLQCVAKGSPGGRGTVCDSGPGSNRVMVVGKEEIWVLFDRYLLHAWKIL